MIQALSLVCSLAGAAFAAPALAAGRAAPVTLVQPLRFDGLAAVVGAVAGARADLMLSQVSHLAAGLVRAGPVEALAATRGVALLPRSELPAAVFVPLANSAHYADADPAAIKSVDLPAGFAARVRRLVGAGRLAEARGALDARFDGVWERREAEGDWEAEARGYFSTRTFEELEGERGQGHLRRVRSLKALPANVRRHVGARRDPVVYAYTGAGAPAYAVFNRRSGAWHAAREDWSLRGALFGPAGGPLGPVRTSDEPSDDD